MPSTDSPRSWASFRAVSIIKDGFVPLAALRNGRKIRSVRLDQDAIGRRLARGFLNVQRFRKRDDAAKTQKKSEIERLPRLLGATRKAVHDAAQSRRGPMLTEHRESVVPSFAGVDDNRHGRVARDAHLFNEDAVLDFTGREIIMIIQPNFAERDHLRMRE